ncbi:MAG: serine/threonine protein kinase [Phycisphaerales bacterium]
MTRQRETLNPRAAARILGETLGEDASVEVTPTDAPSSVSPVAIGGVRIIRRIATGGMGEVYEGAQSAPSRRVAVKMLPPGLVTGEAMRRFQFEVESLGRLRHPGIAQVYSAGIDRADGEPRPWFVMEFIDGATALTAHAEREGLGVRERVRRFLDACDAVHYGHQRGVIHRDLKPANILVGADGAVKIIDFGVARSTDADLASTVNTTSPGRIVGTVQYMAPEQCDGDPRDIDTRADVYALGVVLYELLCGELPYKTPRTSIVAAVRAVHEAQPPRPSSYNARLRGPLEAIMLKALEKDRERRYPSASALAADLRRWLDGEPVSAQRPSRWQRACRWVGRHPALTTTVGSACAGAMIIGAGFGINWWANHRPHSVTRTTGNTALLRSLGGAVLHEWGPEENSDVTFARIVERSEELGGGRIAVIGYGSGSDRVGADGVYFYEAARPGIPLERYSPKVPAALHAELSGDPPTPVAARYAMIVADIFPDEPGDEIVASLSHAPRSPACIAILNANGQQLAVAWHNGTIDDIAWIADEQRLLILARNSEASWSERGVTTSAPDQIHPAVLFRYQPVVGQDGLIHTSDRAGDIEPDWYRALLPQSAYEHLADHGRPWQLSARTHAGDPTRTWLRLILNGTDNFELKISPDGRFTERFVSEPTRTLYPDVPYEAWELGELPALRPR